MAFSTLIGALCSQIVRFLVSISAQQLAGFYPKSFRQAVQNVNARRIDSPLDRTDVGAVNLGLMRKGFLRHVTNLSPCFQIIGQNVANLHVEKSNGL